MEAGIFGHEVSQNNSSVDFCPCCRLLSRLISKRAVTETLFKLYCAASVDDAWQFFRSRSRIPREPMTEFSLADASILDEAAEQGDHCSLYAQSDVFPKVIVWAAAHTIDLDPSVWQTTACQEHQPCTPVSYAQSRWSFSLWLVWPWSDADCICVLHSGEIGVQSIYSCPCPTRALIVACTAGASGACAMGLDHSSGTRVIPGDREMASRSRARRS